MTDALTNDRIDDKMHCEYKVSEHSETQRQPLVDPVAAIYRGHVVQKIFHGGELALAGFAPGVYHFRRRCPKVSERYTRPYFGQRSPRHSGFVWWLSLFKRTQNRSWVSQSCQNG